MNINKYKFNITKIKYLGLIFTLERCNGTYLDRSSYLDVPYVQEGIAGKEKGKRDCCHEEVLQVAHRLQDNVGLGRVTEI